jgi:hypothetical protein
MSLGRLLMLSALALAAILPLGCGGKAAAPGASSEASAQAAARAFYTLFFNGHQRGQLSSAEWQRLAGVTTARVQRELRAGYRGLRGAGGPRCRIADLSVRAVDAHHVVAPTIAVCGGKAIGLGVPLAMTRGHWRVTAVVDERTAAERQKAARFA